MGRDKARLQIGGVPLAVRVARALRQVAYPVVAVGGAAGTGLASVVDPHLGPLAAFATGVDALAGEFRVLLQPVLLVACDMPFVDPGLLGRLIDNLEDAGAIVPVVGERDQPLCACYSPEAAEEAVRLVREEGKTAMFDLLEHIDVRRLPADEWAQLLMDVDTPEEFESARRTLEDPE